MKITSFKCPNCDAPLDVKGDGLDVLTCDHCGARLMVEKMNKGILGTKIYLRELEHEEWMQDKAYDFAEKRLNYKLKKRGMKVLEKNSGDFLSFGIGAILFIILMLILALMWIPTSCSQNSKAAKLEQIENEVVEAIENEDYDLALAKVNQLRADGSFNDDTRKMWDEKREEYIKLINQKKNGDDGDWWPFW